jgi:hypothetical protein
MSLLIKIAVLAILQVLPIRTLADTPPRLEVAVADPSAPLTFRAECRNRLDGAGSLRGQSQGQRVASQKWGETMNSARFTLK